MNKRITYHFNNGSYNSTKGFTLIEILVVIGMLSILSTVVLVAVNPRRQFAEARNSERQNDVSAVLNAVSERIADNGGQFLQSPDARNDSCATALTASSTDISKMALDIRSCLVPTYISELPHDPLSGVNKCTTLSCDTSGETYDLGYQIEQNPTTNRITVCSPGSAESAIASSSAFCLTR
jgi:prepilin-type N-terminal cleavage/methylation domain-containing protein